LQKIINVLAGIRKYWWEKFSEINKRTGTTIPDSRVHSDFRCRSMSCYSYYCGLHLYRKSDDSDLQRIEQLKSDIKHLQSQGVLVKFAYGGEEYGNTDFYYKLRSSVISNAQTVADQVVEFGLDGVDLTQNQGFGDENMVSGEQTSLQLLFLHHLREKLPADKIITYTFPGDSQYGNQDINFPYRDILRYGQNYVDVFNVYRATYKSMREMMEDFEIDPSKIVWGLAIGCNQNFADVDLGKAVETAEYVKAYGMAGVMTWSINRDTNHRIEPVGSCTDLQAGYEDGTYLKTIHSALNN